MIRPTTPDDTAALIALADATGLFRPNELDELSVMLADYNGGNIDSDHFWITDDDGGPVGVAYYAPAPMTDQTWYLYVDRRPTRPPGARTRCDTPALR